MTNNQFSYEFFSGLFASGLGSFLGTMVKMMRNPPESALTATITAFTAISIGTLAGGVASEYFGFGPWVTSSAAACGAYISDEIIRAVDMHSKILPRLGLMWWKKKDD